MSFEDKLINAWYELIAPEKEELLSDLKTLEEKDNFSYLQKSIDILWEKINESNNWKEKYILESQLKELEKLNKLYEEFKEINLTNTTKNKLNQLIKDISLQINKNKNIINDDVENIEKLLNEEKNKLSDTFDIINAWTIRDTVENNIDIIWINESIPREDYQEFFDIFTLEYINHIENTKKIDNKILDQIIKNDWLYFEKEEFKDFLEWFLEKAKWYNFNIKINLNKDWKKEKILINLKEYRNYFNIKKERETRESRLEQMKQIIEDNIEKLSTKERMFHIETTLNEKWFDIYYDEVLDYLKNTTIYLTDSKIKLNKDFIEKNKDKILNNLKVLTSLIIEIECDWNHKAINKSSAEWLWQWLTNDWRYSNEYMYNRVWSSKKIKWKKMSKTRKVRLTSSFETDLRSIRKIYNDSKILEELSFIPKSYNWKIDLRPWDLNIRQQIKILILRFIINNKTTINSAWYKVSQKDYLATSMIWNKWAVKEIYKIFHHTNPDKNTLDRIESLTEKYQDKFQKIN